MTPHHALRHFARGLYLDLLIRRLLLQGREVEFVGEGIRV